MAFSNTFDTTNQGPGVSNREDLTDVLSILAPEETPILSSASKQRATATNVEWTVDALSSPSTAGISEGADVTAFTDQFSGRARLGNRIQKFRRDYMVSDLQEAVDSVGPAKIAQAEAKAIRELKRDVEATISGTQDSSTEDGAGTANALRGLGDWIDSAGPADVPAAFRTNSDAVQTGGSTLSEANFNKMISGIFRETGSTSDLMLVADTVLRTQISDYARFGAQSTAATSEKSGVRSVNYDGMSGTIKLSVDLYQSDHGIVSIVNMNPDCAPDTTNKNNGYMINPEYYGIHELIPMGSTRLPNLGGGERGFVDCALTLGVYHPAAHGKITN
tara:strand:+ start:668 stop:1666 length:999 start_codon:yes stop_codon:yes gene_type:complete